MSLHGINIITSVLYNVLYPINAFWSDLCKKLIPYTYKEWCNKRFYIDIPRKLLFLKWMIRYLLHYKEEDMVKVMINNVRQMTTTMMPTGPYTFHEMFHNQIEKWPSLPRDLKGKSRKASGHKISVANCDIHITRFSRKKSMQWFRCLCGRAGVLAFTEFYKFVENLKRLKKQKQTYVLLAWNKNGK